MPEAIKITGLREFIAAGTKLDADLPKAVRIALNAAAELVVDDAVPEIPKESGRAARSVKARSTRTAVRIVAGGARAPHYPWLDFGGRVGKGKSVKRPFYSDGRYIYAAYYANRDSGKFTEVMSEALVDVARAAGLEVI